MVDTSHIFSCAILFLILCQKTYSFKWFYLGDYVTDEEYYNKKLCYSKYCLLDADRIISAASLSSSVNPCDDFKSFAAGEFFKYRVPNDSYGFNGFQNDVRRAFKEKQRAVLEEPVRPDEPRIFKVLKKYFQQCTDLDKVRATAGGELISYLRAMGGSLLVANGTWNVSNFDPKVWFDFEPNYATVSFLQHHLNQCKDPRNQSREILCFQADQKKYHGKLEQETLRVLKSLKLNQSAKEAATESAINFILKKKSIVGELENMAKFEVVKIKDLAAKFPKYNLNWLKIINDQLMKKSRQTGDDEILIENPEMMTQLFKLMEETKESDLADSFAASFFYYCQKAFISHTITRKDISRRGSKRSFQRFEQCISHLEYAMRPALEALVARKYFNASTQKAATRLVEEVLADVIVKIFTLEELENTEVRRKLIDKLSTIKLWVMFPDDIFNETKIEKFYDELELDGSESFVTMWQTLDKHPEKLNVEKSSNPQKIFNTFLKYANIKYHIDENVLNIPVINTLYIPMFHYARARFFNTAALYMKVAGAFNNEITKYVNRDLNQSFVGLISNVNLAYENYVKWEAMGGKDLNLGAFKLTGRQMFWLTRAQVYATKDHKIDAQFVNPRAKLQQKYFHVRNKSISKFREDFNCGNMTESEEMLYQEYLEKFSVALE